MNFAWGFLFQSGVAVHGRPIVYQWIRNGTVVMVGLRKPPYLFKRLVNVYKVCLNVSKINR